MQIRYVGPFDEIEVPCPFTGAQLVVARQGETVDVADTDLAARLLDQASNWQPVSVPAPVEAPAAPDAVVPTPDAPAPAVAPATTVEA